MQPSFLLRGVTNVLGTSIFLGLLKRNYNTANLSAALKSYEGVIIERGTKHLSEESVKEAN